VEPLGFFWKPALPLRENNPFGILVTVQDLGLQRARCNYWPSAWLERAQGWSVRASLFHPASADLTAWLTNPRQENREIPDRVSR
jgi:hypothetical protein